MVHLRLESAMRVLNVLLTLVNMYSDKWIHSCTFAQPRKFGISVGDWVIFNLDTKGLSNGSSNCLLILFTFYLLSAIDFIFKLNFICHFICKREKHFNVNKIICILYSAGLLLHHLSTNFSIYKTFDLI